MDFGKLIARVKGILMSPKTEWPVIAGEEATTGGLYGNYIVWLAGVSALASFISLSIIGVSVSFLGTYRMGLATGLLRAVVTWVIALVFVWLFAWLINVLAPGFGGQKNQLQALKAAAYAFTAGWVASIATILPVLGGLIALAGLIYGIYLLYLGLPHTMKCPPEKSAGYTAVVVVIAIVAGIILWSILGRLMFRTGVGFGGMDRGAVSGMMHDRGSFDADSPAGKLQEWAKGMEEAGKQAEEAQKSGDPAAAMKAAGGVVAAALSGKGGSVEALPPDRVKSFLPESLGGLTRTEISAQRNGAMGVQVSTAEARYSDNAGHEVELKVADLGGAAGLAALASWANIEEDKQTKTGYEKTYKSGGNVVHEEWDDQSKRGQYTSIVGDRFSVEASGNVANMDMLKSAVNSIDLNGLAALRNEGVKAR